MNADFYSKSFFQTQLQYQLSGLPESICLIYDPLKTAQGQLTIRAFRISEKYLEVAKEQYNPESADMNNVTVEEIRKHKIKHQHMFVELPVHIKSSYLSNMLLFQLEDEDQVNPNKSILETATSFTLERNLKLMDRVVDEVVNDSNKFNQYQKVVSKSKQQKQNWIAKRKQENEERRSEGVPQLPVLEEADKAFPLPAAPNRIEPMLRSAQINEITKNVKNLAANSMGKLFIAESFKE